MVKCETKQVVGYAVLQGFVWKIRDPSIKTFFSTAVVTLRKRL